MEQKGNISKLVLAFVTLILGLALITQISLSTNVITSTASYTDTVNIAPLRMEGGGLNYTLAESNKLYASAILSHPAGVTWKTEYSQCAITTVKYYNQSGDLMSNSADYTWVKDGNGANGWLRLKNVVNLNGTTSNLTTITYTTCPNDYLAQGWGRTVINLVPGFFGITLLLVAVGLFYSFYRDMQ